MTKYLVLEKRPDVTWRIIGQAEASGPVQARKKVTDQEGEFLTVPVRNATFEAVEVKQPPPKATSVLVHPDTYLSQQPTLPIDSEEPVAA